MRGIKDFIFLYLKGLGMGAADAVPGVSGGTIAFISGIYEELIESIRSFDAQAIRLLFSFKIQALWKHVNATFLVVLFAGIGTALVTLSKIIPYLLKNYPELLWSFFFGLIIASTVLVSRQVTKWNLPVIFSLMIGVSLGYLITEIGPTETPENLGFIFLSGSIAICAMILPGISGSFILLLLGKYEYIFTALKELKITIIGVFAAGCLIGLLSFSHLLNWMLKKYHNITISILIGIMLGSLNKVWPWKITIKTFMDRHGEMKPLIQHNVSPFDYPQEPYLSGAVLLAIAGFILVYFLDKLSLKDKT